MMQLTDVCYLHLWKCQCILELKAAINAEILFFLSWFLKHETVDCVEVLMNLEVSLNNWTITFWQQKNELMLSIVTESV